MIDKPRPDSSRDLLEELEEGWATPALPFVAAKALAPTPTIPASPAPAADLVSPVARSVAQIPAAVAKPTRTGSAPDLDSVDEGWLDDLFPGEGDGERGDDEGDEDDDEEPEAELPDEGLDPVAYAAAKKERDERTARRKEKKRTRAEAKRQKQKARAAANRQKQKSKRTRTGKGPESSRRVLEAAAESTPEPAGDSADAPRARQGELEAARPAKSAPGTVKAARAPASIASSVKLLAIVLAVLLALGALAAALIK